ncbi:MAG: hypothetical protein ACHQ53_16185, partial [Polyangiales bacterium]
MLRTPLIVLALALPAGACTPKISGKLRGIGDAAASDASSRAGLEPTPRGYAVVSTDYSVTSVSLLKPDGTPLQRDFVDSGSSSAGLVTALSGDVILPTRAGDPGVLVLLDRFRTDVVTRIDLRSGEILGQVKTIAPNAQSNTTYSSNPHDYVYIDPGTAWITRYEPNTNAGAGDADLGADLLRLDPTRFVRTGDRIDFSQWNGLADRTNPDTGEHESVTVYARPSGLVRLGDF